MIINQFSLGEAHNQQIVVLTNTVFNEVESILIAPVQFKREGKLIKGFQIPVLIDDTNYYVDLLDLATISKQYIKPTANVDLSEYRTEIRAGLDLLIDGF